MKHNLEVIISAILGILCGIAIHGSYIAHQPIEEPKPVIEYVYIEKEPEIVTETVTEIVYLPAEEDSFRNYSEQDEWYFKDLAMREAEGEGVVGMLWVMYTGECRCEAFGETVEQMWSSSAFQTSINRSGRTPNEDCLKAYEIFREGWTPRPLYFRRGTYHTFGTELCSVGNHYFSTK